MCFAAVYLDHHWVVDVVLGILYCLGASALVRLVFRRIERGHATAEVAPLAG